MLSHIAVLALLASLTSLAPTSASAQQPPTERSTAGTFSRSDFDSLRWLEGDWQGSARGEAPFFERYRFVNDSTIRMTYFADSTFTAETGEASVELRGGRISHAAGAARWHATHADSAGLHFAPAERATNRFTWRRAGTDSWTALLRSASGRVVTYELQRVKR